MLDAHETHMAMELLEMVPWCNLWSLTQTVTFGFIAPLTHHEACAVILQHATSAEQLLSRKKLTAEVLFTYLHSKKVAVSKSNRNLLKQMVIDLWRKESPAIYDQSTDLPTTESDVATLRCVDNGTALADTPTLAYQLAEEFSDWFYSLLNRSRSGSNGCLLGADSFFPDCCIRMRLESSSESVDNEVRGDAAAVVKLLLDTQSAHNLHFNPNLTADGLRGVMEPHGLATVAVCGTLHQGREIVGVFEQLFRLTRDPFAENSWKINYTEVKLKSQDLVTGLPALKDTEMVKQLLQL